MSRVEPSFAADIVENSQSSVEYPMLSDYPMLNEECQVSCTSDEVVRKKWDKNIVVCPVKKKF